MVQRILDQRYELEELIGGGGMADVYKAKDCLLNRPVAVKILHEEFKQDKEFIDKFQREAQAAARLSHPNIVNIYDVGVADGDHYIVMEYVPGRTLKDRIRQEGHLSVSESLRVAREIAEALAHAHANNLVHCDIKPHNILMMADGHAKVADFGIARAVTESTMTYSGNVIGSVHYFSPEQAKGTMITPKSDVYSLGVVLYEMLTGKLPFEGETALQIVMQHINEVPIIPSAFVPGIPKGMDDIVMHAMSAHISRRYESAEKMYEDMEVLRSDPNARFHYVASEDNSGETQIIGADIQRAARRSAAEHEAASVEGAAAPRTRTRTQPQTRTRTGFRRKEQDEPDGFFEKLAERPGMAVGMAVGVIAVISLLLVGILMITGSSDKSEKIIVPDLIGRNIDEVMADPDITDNFTVKEATERQESDRPVGEILEQDPNADGKKKATKGTIITVTVSSGGENVRDTYKVIDFTGKTLDYVQAALASRDIKCEVVEEYSDDVEEGKVIRTDPEAGAELEKGATLTVYISKGKQKDDNENVAVPGLLGMTEDEARAALEAKGLKIGSVDSVDSSAEAGSVVWQSQDAGAEVTKGSTVNIQISKGKSTSNNNSPDNNSGGNSGGQDNGDGDYDDTPSLGSATIPVSLPDNTDTAHVIIYVDGVIQYDDTCSTSGGSTSISVSGSVGDHDVTVSVDGSTTSQTYTFS